MVGAVGIFNWKPKPVLPNVNCFSEVATAVEMFIGK